MINEQYRLITQYQKKLVFINNLNVSHFTLIFLKQTMEWTSCVINYQKRYRAILEPAVWDQPGAMTRSIFPKTPRLNQYD
ncbi:MAG: hypothetical protein KatS3mg104_0974 [Phycisphaerae bacterium]|nr:MAG: hypothetical protein KatS3mg104_0974 [Phycisphaerae bacterium]